MFAPWGNLGPFLPQGTWLFFEVIHVQREQGLKLFGGATMFLREQMCSKLNVIVIFSNEF
jgi:hypothetical protein